MSDIKAQVRSFIDKNFLVPASLGLKDSDSLLDYQIVDSTGFLELIHFVGIGTLALGREIRFDELTRERDGDGLGARLRGSGQTGVRIADYYAGNHPAGA